jgi:hypothetical protein
VLSLSFTDGRGNESEDITFEPEEELNVGSIPGRIQCGETKEVEDAAYQNSDESSSSPLPSPVCVASRNVRETSIYRIEIDI